MAQTQLYSSEAVENFATAFPRRSENSFAWGNAISYYLGLPQLRGFWPMSSVNENGNPYDLSGQGRTLTNNNAATFGVYGLQSYTALNGVNQYHSRADEAGLDITGSLTFGAWIRPSANVGAGIIGKYDTAGNNRAYLIRRDATTTITLFISSNGIVATSIPSTEFAPINTWSFICGRYTQATTMSIFINNIVASLAVGIPASISNSAAQLDMGAWRSGTFEFFPGYIALPFLCAAACSDAQINALYWLGRPLFFGT
jgi:hypothetical protein